MQHPGEEVLYRGKNNVRVCGSRGSGLVDAGLPADIFRVHPAEHAAGREGPDKVAAVLFEGRSKIFTGSGGIGAAEDVRDVRDDLPVPEPVVPERFYDSVRIVGKDDIPLIEQFDDEVVREAAFPDIEDEDPFEAVLADGQHFSPGDVLAQEHGKLRGVLRGFRQILHQVGPPAGLDDQLVLCLVPAIEPDRERTGVELVDLVYPERELPGQLGRHCHHVDPAHALFGCHGGLYQITYGLRTKK